MNLDSESKVIDGRWDFFCFRCDECVTAKKLFIGGFDDLLQCVTVSVRCPNCQTLDEWQDSMNKIKQELEKAKNKG